MQAVEAVVLIRLQQVLEVRVEEETEQQVHQEIQIWLYLEWVVLEAAVAEVMKEAKMCKMQVMEVLVSLS
jgi:hypothetical protein